MDIVHTSLRDFSTSLQRSGDLCVESAESHLRITMCCLQVMAMQSEQLLFEAEAAKYASRCWIEHLHLTCWIEHLHLTFKTTDSHYVRYDALAEKLELFIGQCFQAWFNTVLNTEGSSATEGKLELLKAILQQSKVSLLFVVAYLH